MEPVFFKFLGHLPSPARPNGGSQDEPYTAIQHSIAGWLPGRVRAFRPDLSEDFIAWARQSHAVVNGKQINEFEECADLDGTPLIPREPEPVKKTRRGKRGGTARNS